MILASYILPHPPLIIPEVGRGEETRIQQTIFACQRVAQEIADLRPDTIVIASPHAPYYRDAFFLDQATGYRGDLEAFGFPQIQEDAPYDRELRASIQELAEAVALPLYPDVDDAPAEDHATLVALHFVHQYLPAVPIVRLGLAMLPPSAHYRLGQCVQQAAEKLEKKVVFIASGDLSHVLKATGPYGYHKQGPRFDQQVRALLKQADFQSLLLLPASLYQPAAQCGLPAFWVMAGVFDGFQVEARELSYEGPFGVGYGVFAMLPGKPDATRTLFAHPVRETGDPYVDLARVAISTYLHEGRVVAIPDDLPVEFYNTRAGCFVSLHWGKDLRGCIGTMEASTSNLAEEIVQNAISAATSDPRFSPVQVDELTDLTVSVDVLQPLESIADIAQLDPQRYGVMVYRGQRRGVLLPALEGVESGEEQVAIALAKAHIDPEESYQLARFEVVRHG